MVSSFKEKVLMAVTGVGIACMAVFATVGVIKRRPDLAGLQKSMAGVQAEQKLAAALVPQVSDKQEEQNSGEQKTEEQKELKQDKDSNDDKSNS